MPIAMSVVWDVVKSPIKSKQLADLLLDFDRVLGLEIDKKEEIQIPEEVMQLIQQRVEARKNKDWAESDRLRDKINELGFIIKDSKDGYSIEAR